MSSKRVPVGRLGVVAAVGVSVLLFAGCVPEPEETAGSTSPSPSASTSTTLPAPTESAASPSPSGSASSTFTPAEGEIFLVSEALEGSTLEVTAMVQGVSEADGTCTLELIGSGLATEVPGTAGNGVTYCGVMSLTVPDTDLASGTFRVLYASPSTQAESAVTTLESLS